MEQRSEVMPRCPFCRMNTSTGKELLVHMENKHPEDVPQIDRNSQRKLVQRQIKELKPIIVDGNNIAYFDKEEKAKVSNLKKMRSHLKKDGFDPIILISSALRHSIDTPMDLTRMINLNWVIETIEGDDDDVAIIEEALRRKCPIVSNDSYAEYLDVYDKEDWSLRKAIKKFTFNEGKFKLI